MTYLEYQEYLELGGVCDATVFNRNIDRACGAIDEVTYNRIEGMTSIPRRAKALCRDLVEYFATNVSNSEQGIASHSESAGAVSESVSYVTKSAEDVKSDVGNMIYDYLGTLKNDNGIPLLYKGAAS